MISMRWKDQARILLQTIQETRIHSEDSQSGENAAAAETETVLAQLLLRAKGILDAEGKRTPPFCCPDSTFRFEIQHLKIRSLQGMRCIGR